MFGIPIYIIVIIIFAILIVWGYIRINKWILYGGYGSGYHLQLSILFCIILVIGSKWINSYLINEEMAYGPYGGNNHSIVFFWLIGNGVHAKYGLDKLFSPKTYI